MPAALFALVTVAAAGCKSHRSDRGGGADLAKLLSPQAAAAALGRAGGGHVRARTRLTVRGAAVGGDAAAADSESVTTTGEISMDPRGHYHLVEANDRGGQRDMTYLGREMISSIDGGRRVARPTQEPEPLHVLAEALGGPYAAWDVIAQGVKVTPQPATKANGRSAYGFSLARDPAEKPRDVAPNPAPGRAWRSSIKLTDVKGEVLFDQMTNALLHASITAAYTFERPPETVSGEVEATIEVDRVGAVPPLERPEAEPLQERQRTALDEKALLEGLAGEPRKAPR